MSAGPQTIDEYLAPLSKEKQAALGKLRRAIKSAAPKAEECIRFQADNPLPAVLVRQLVKTRIAERAAQQSAKAIRAKRLR